MSDPVIAAVIAAYRRDRELARLLDSLANASPPPAVTLVVDNAALDSTRQLVAAYPGAHYLAADRNIGPGYAWRLGMQSVNELCGLQPTHFLTLDDDVVPGPEAIGVLHATAAAAGAAMVAPLLSDAGGRLWGFPEPAKRELRPLIRAVKTPSEALERLGARPHRFTWCTGACVLVSAQAVRAVGAHRCDFFMLGEDLEFSMRVADRFPAVFTCRVDVPHLPPPPPDEASARRANRRKFHALLTNLGYLSFHCPHSAHMRGYLAGNFKRYFMTEGLGPASVARAARCFWNGVIRGRPAGWRHAREPLPAR